MTSVEVSAEGIDLPAWTDSCKAFVHRVLAAVSTESHEISILFCSTEFIKKLNNTYRGRDEPTDVLSFSQYEGNGHGRGPAGDVVIALDSVAENARVFGVPVEEEIERVIIHGILHLLGWNHADDSPNQEMLKLQEKILNDLGGEQLL